MIIEYPLYLLNEDEFEDVVTSICEEVLGMGTINYTPGKDGGRDGRFIGTAQNFPSTSSPWMGTTIIQSKHTNNPAALCSDSDFKSILTHSVVPAIKEMKKSSQIDNYVLFTNRKLTGIAEPKITDLIEAEVSVDNRVIGIDKIQSILGSYPHIVKKHKLDTLLLPFDFYPEDIKNIIVAIHDKDELIARSLEDLQTEFIKPDIEEKNRLNSLGRDYFNWMKGNSISYFSRIKEFLQDPKNSIYKQMYDNATDDIQEKILISRDDYDAFEHLLSDIQKVIIGKETEGLVTERRKVRLLLHYMYFNCDIGKKQ